jgi:hypothetical protein
VVRGSTSEIRGAVPELLGTSERARWGLAEKYAKSQLQRGLVSVGDISVSGDALVGCYWGGWRFVEACSAPMGYELVVRVCGRDVVAASMRIASERKAMCEMLLVKQSTVYMLSDSCDRL